MTAPPSRNTIDLGSPPYDPEAEAAVLACVLSDPALMSELAAALRPDDLWGYIERTIYEAMLRLHAASKPVDVILLAGELSDHRQLDRHGDGNAVCVFHLVDLARHTLPLAHLHHMRYYVGRVREVSRRRRARLQGMQMIEAAQSLSAAETPALAAIRRANGRAVATHARKTKIGS